MAKCNRFSHFYSIRKEKKGSPQFFLYPFFLSCLEFFKTFRKWNFPEISINLKLFFWERKTFQKISTWSQKNVENSGLKTRLCCRSLVVGRLLDAKNSGFDCWGLKYTNRIGRWWVWIPVSANFFSPDIVAKIFTLLPSLYQMKIKLVRDVFVLCFPAYMWEMCSEFHK